MFKVKNIILSLALLGCSGLAQAQQVEQRIDSLQILIGQQTVLHLKASVKQGDKVQLPSFKPQQQITPGVEVVEQSKGDTSHIGDDRMVVSRDYTLTSFDEKVYVIPALNVKVNGKNCHGNQLALKVLTVPVDTVHPNQFYPPKDVQDNPFSWSEWSPLFWLSLLLLILCGAWLYLRNRLKNNKPIITHIRIVKRVPAHEKALNQINVIKQQHVENQETQKAYYTQLTNTLREYIVSRFGFNAMEMTSAEIIERLLEEKDKESIHDLKVMFETADLVKFAKYAPLMNENDMNLVNAVDFINQTKIEEDPNAKKEPTEIKVEEKRSKQGRIALLCSIAITGVAALIALYLSVRHIIDLFF